MTESDDTVADEMGWEKRTGKRRMSDDVVPAHILGHADILGEQKWKDAQEAQQYYGAS